MTVPDQNGYILRGVRWTGLDVWRALLPPTWQVRAAARKMLRGPWAGLDPALVGLVLETQWGAFRIVSSDGRVERQP